MSGHADLLLGYVTARDPSARRRSATGAARRARSRARSRPGSRTARFPRSRCGVERGCDNALAIARLLAARDDVEGVRYPGLPNDPGHEIARRQMSGYGVGRLVRPRQRRARRALPRRRPPRHRRHQLRQRPHVRRAPRPLGRRRRAGGLHPALGRLRGDGRPAGRRRAGPERLTLLVTGGTGYLGGELVRQAGAAGGAPAPRAARPRRGEARLRGRASLHGDPHCLPPGRSTRDRRRVSGGGGGQRRRRRPPDPHLDATWSSTGPSASRTRRTTSRTRSTTMAVRSSTPSAGCCELHPGALVVRTSLLVGREQPGRHERAVLEAARGEREMTFFEDEWRSPILVSDLAAALLELAGTDVSGDPARGRSGRREPLRARLHDRHGPRAARRPPAPWQIAESGLDRAANCVLDSGRARALLRAPLPGVLDRIGAGWKSGSGG